MVPDQAAFYRAWERPTPEQAARWVRETLLTTSGPSPESRGAPVVGETQAAGTEADLETRIDTEPLIEDRDARAYQRVLSYFSARPVAAMMEVGETAIDPDQVFVGTRSALVLMADSWPPFDAVEAATAVRGKILVIGNSQELVDAIASRTGAAGSGGGVYKASWRHSRELSSYERLTRLIDFPQIPPGGDAREPMFFSENLASLGRVLGRVREAEIVMHDQGSALRETVVYRVAP